MLLVGLVAGCAGRHADCPCSALPPLTDPAAHVAGYADRYPVGCPDVLEIAFAEAPGTVRCAVGPDGCVELGDGLRLRVEGRTAPEAAQAIAAAAGLPPERVRVRVAEYRCRHLYLHGEVAGSPRAVPYVGPEPVVELLRRVGGLGPGAAPTDIQVVRPNVAAGGPPNVFRVDLQAILQRGDPSTNVCVQPFDQIYVAQSRRSCVCRCLPPWLRPFAERACGMRPS